MTHETYKRGARRFGGKKRARFVRLLGNMTFPDGVILAFNKISFDWMKIIRGPLDCFCDDLQSNRLAGIIYAHI